MKARDFRCIVCDELRERGVFVRVEHGAFYGHVVKVCKRAECAAEAKAGTRWVADPLNEHKQAKRKGEK